MQHLELIAMANDSVWGLPNKLRDEVRALNDSRATASGNMDDADLLVSTSTPSAMLLEELDAYNDFCGYRLRRIAELGDTSAITRCEWLESKRRERQVIKTKKRVAAWLVSVRCGAVQRYEKLTSRLRL